MNKRVLLELGLVLALTRSVQAQRCDFKGYSTFKLSDFVQTAATTKAAPTYPEDAKKLGRSGWVYVRVLIDQKGRVERACADTRLSSTSESTLVEAAEKAAKRWKFKSNFGLPQVPKTLKGRYLEGSRVQFSAYSPRAAKGQR